MLRYLRQTYPDLRVLEEEVLPEVGRPVDFYLPELRLVFEFDGGLHWIDTYMGRTRKLGDERRDEILRRTGYRVVRIDMASWISGAAIQQIREALAVRVRP